MTLARPKTNAEVAIFMHRVSEDFGVFLTELWKDRGLDTAAPLSRIEMDMAKFIEDAKHEHEYRAVLGFRGMGKSYIGTAAFTCYRLLRDPKRKIIIISKTGKPMRGIIKQIKGWLKDVWFLQHLAPTQDSGRNTSSEFDTGTAEADEHVQPSVRALGVMTQLEANRAHTIIPDDIETKNNSATVDTQEKLAVFCEEFVNILYPNLSKSKDPGVIAPIDPPEICGFGTIKPDYGSIWNHLESLDYKIQTYPIVYPNDEDALAARTIAPIILNDLKRKNGPKPGDPVVPLRFNADHVDKLRYGKPDRKTGVRKPKVTPSQWYKEFMLYRDLTVTMPFKLRLENLMVMNVDRDTAPIHVVYSRQDSHGTNELDIPTIGIGNDRFYKPGYWEPQRAPYTGTKAFIDPAGRGDDKVGGAAIGHLAGLFHLKSLVGWPGGYDPETLGMVAEWCRLHGVTELYCEKNYGGGMFDRLLEPYLTRLFLRPDENPLYPRGWRCAIIDNAKVTQAWGVKELRIVEILESFTASHRVIIDESVARNMDFQHQFTRIRPEKNSLGFSPNELDAFAGCLLAWKTELSLDPNIQGSRLKKTDEIDELEKTLAFLEGSAPPRSKRDVNWLGIY